ncbi:unnamed protein product [Ceratitis capitata]|uniref:(Mediterranean fruit fly) hypothetical protein n=1 Tax=Ceratitis capitata TaxID=7213 RepID=A0A811UNZ1_CERCA|nr:unnamed protein product [Ceratitis capitata]
MAAKLLLLAIYERFTILLEAVVRAGEREISKTSGKILRRRTVMHIREMIKEIIASIINNDIVKAAKKKYTSTIYIHKYTQHTRLKLRLFWKPRTYQSDSLQSATQLERQAIKTRVFNLSAIAHTQLKRFTKS